MAEKGQESWEGRGGCKTQSSGQADIEIDEYVHVSGSVDSRYRDLLLCSQDDLDQ